MIREEFHPYNDSKIPEECRLLIVGTAPPPRFSLPRSSNPLCQLGQDDIDFYYGSKANRMWEMLNNIAAKIDGKEIFTSGATNLHRSNAMRDFLQRHQMWMRDVLQKYQRRNCTAKDSDIIEPDVRTLTDFQAIFSSHLNLHTIAFTSEKAAQWTFKALAHQNVVSQEAYAKALAQWRLIVNDSSLERYCSQKFAKPMLRTQVGQRDVAFYVLPTPTARSAVKGLNVQTKEGIYERVLFKP
jgi:G:T/U-mismatch repair DNA glycosylase